MTKPFENVRVLDFSQVFAGPYCGYLLALLGADVIKIEQPGKGDDARIISENAELVAQKMAPMFLCAGGNKRAITLDLKKPEAIAVAKRLAETADVVLENFRPGVMKRLGLDYEVLKDINPKLIYCAVSGFGQEGPESGTPAYDGAVQASSGLMSITGHPENGPTRCGFAVVDAATGMTAAFALASALYQRTHTGRGQQIDVAMLDSILSFMSPTVVEYTAGGIEPIQFGNMAVSRRPTADLFQVGDGFILMACNNELQFQKLCRAIGREDIPGDPRFADWPARSANRAALKAEIEAAFAHDGAVAWERRLAEAGVPASRVNSIPQAIDREQMVHRTLLQQVGGMTLLNAGFKLAHGGPAIETPPPGLGEHTEEVLAEAGYAPAEIESLRAAGAI